MAVLIDNRQNSIKVSPKAIQEAAQAALNALDCPDGELSIVVVDDRQIARLNLAYLNRRGSTNVIAFPMQEGRFTDISPGLLGDVVISAETADREAGAAGIGFRERFLFLLIHGILHLFGYDHETGEADALKMEAKSDELIQKIGTRG